jgi:hypothetical protein
VAADAKIRHARVLDKIRSVAQQAGPVHARDSAQGDRVVLPEVRNGTRFPGSPRADD